MAHAAVLSLKLTMKRFLSHSEEMFIYDDLDSFLARIQSIPSIEIVDAASQRRVIDAVQKLEHLIESHVSDLLLFHQSKSISIADPIISFNLLLSQQVLIVGEVLSSIVTTLLITDKVQRRRRYCFSTSGYAEKQQNLVGFDDHIKTLQEWIWYPTSSLLVRSVVGMTGIGKIALVKQVYNDPRVVEEFKIRLFVHIGRRYNRLKEIQLLVLNQFGVPSDKVLHKNSDYLNHQLSEALSSKRYLIVLEDVWADIHVWDEIEYRGFPHNGKGSRIIIISQIQSYLSTHNVFLLTLLKDDDSWKLLHQTAHSTSEEECSRELERMGKKIARNCEGLPAAIIQVGENLRGKSFQEWKTLSEKEDPLVITRDDDTPLSKALYFGYMMPQYLKLCFLYMGVFPKYYEISQSKLIKLWVSEGLVYAYPRLTSLEEIAGQYLDLLICQRVVLREKQASVDIEKTKNCRLHFTFRSLCVNEAKREKFFHIIKKYTDCKPKNMRSQQRLCVHNNVVLGFRQVQEWMESTPDARSLLCFGQKQQYPILLPLCFRLLKILDALAIRFYEFPRQEVLALIHLRYFAITCDRELPTPYLEPRGIDLLSASYHQIFDERSGVLACRHLAHA